MAIQLLQSGQELTAYDTLGIVTKNANQEYDMRKEEIQTQGKTSLPCDYTINTNTTNTKDDASSGEHYFPGIGGDLSPVLERIEEIASDAGLIIPIPFDEYQVRWKASATFQYKKNTCDTISGNCGGTDASIGYEVTDAEENSGGYAPSFWPTVLKKPECSNGGIAQQALNIGRADKSSVAYDCVDQENLKNMFCMLTPLSKQGNSDLVVDDNISANPNAKPTPCIAEYATAVACGDWESKLVDNSGACGICNSNLGDLAKRILATAGQTFNVPASNIYAAMLHEGADWPEFNGKFTDENVRKWSNTIECGGEPMPRCNNDIQETQPPFGFLKNWFYGDGYKAIWNAVQEIDPSRNTKEKVSRCNFLDAAFGAAKLLQQGSTMTESGNSCGSYTFDNSQPGSCSAWTDAKIAQSQVAYMGQCPNAPKYYPLPFTIEDVVGWNNQYSCN